jgi:hypothetical protein
VAFKFALGLPLAVLGVWSVNKGAVSEAHQSLIAQLDYIRLDGFSLSDLGSVYPPLPLILAFLVGGSAVGLAVISSMLAGTALHAVWERMVQFEVPHATQLTLLCSVTLIPAVWFIVGQDVAAIGGLAMLVIALSGFLRFVLDGDTIGGFTAGLFLGAAFLFDPAALAYAICLLLATPFLAATRYRGEPAATRAMIAVLGFPTAAILLGWAFLEWRFGGTAFGFVSRDLGLFQFDVSPLADLWDAIGRVLRDTLFTPVYIVVAVILSSRRPLAATGLVIPLMGLVLVQWSGLTYSSTMALVLLSFLAMASVPSGTGRLVRWGLPAAAAVQLVLNIAVPPDVAGFQEWYSLL